MKLIAKEKIIVELWDGRVDGALAQVRYELSINYELKGGVWSRNHRIFMSALKKFTRNFDIDSMFKISKNPINPIFLKIGLKNSSLIQNQREKNHFEDIQLRNSKVWLQRHIQG